MQTEMMDLVKKFNESALASSKRVSDLNMKTVESFASQQGAFLATCFDMGNKNLEALSKAKDPQEVFALNQKALQSYSEEVISTARASAELMTTARDEYTAIAEDMVKSATSYCEEVSSLSKQVMDKNMDDATQAVEKAAEKASEMTEQAATATKEAAEKAVELSQEVAKRTVGATQKAVGELKAVA